MHRTIHMVMPICTQRPSFQEVTQDALFIHHRLLKQPALSMLQQTGSACMLRDTGLEQDRCYHVRMPQLSSLECFNLQQIRQSYREPETTVLQGWQWARSLFPNPQLNRFKCRKMHIAAAAAVAAAAVKPGGYVVLQLPPSVKPKV